jgi:putative aldouronate transport system permease protein
MVRRTAGRTGGIADSRSDTIVRWVSNVMITVLAVVCLYPFLNVIAKSFSGTSAVVSGRVNSVWPVDFTVESYKMVLFSDRFLGALQNTVFITVAGTTLNLMLTIFVSYAVTRRDLPGARFIMILYIVTMIFGGGLIPTYLVVVDAGLRNSLWALIIPTLVTPYNLVLMRNYMFGLPYEIEESAVIDGASHFRALFQIIVPLSLPSIATIALFCAVTYWNSYFNALIYIDDRSRAVLQIYLRELMMNVQDAERNNLLDRVADALSNDSIRGAAVLASTLPILCVYPFLQKYYVQGVTLGAVKG